MSKDKEVVVEGATIKCTMGDKTTTLKVTSNSKYKVQGKKVATMMDFTPGANLFPPVATFGTCKPYKAVPPPGCLCTPIPAGTWQKAFSKKKVGPGLMALKGDAILMCTRGGGTISFEDTGQTLVIEDPNDYICKECGKKHDPHPTGAGAEEGNSGKLARNILEAHYGDIPQNKHPLTEPTLPGQGGNGYTSEAHHLICSESMDDDEWKKLRKVFGYNINCKENGIFLPASMLVACQLHIPLHFKNHEKGEALYKLNYVEAVKNVIDSVKRKVKKKSYCDDIECATFISDLNDCSKRIWGHVKSFAWGLSSDSEDYDTNGAGCRDSRTIRGKKKNVVCIKGRHHGFNISSGSYFKEQ